MTITMTLRQTPNKKLYPKEYQLYLEIVLRSVYQLDYQYASVLAAFPQYVQTQVNAREHLMLYYIDLNDTIREQISAECGHNRSFVDETIEVFVKANILQVCEDTTYLIKNTVLISQQGNNIWKYHARCNPDAEKPTCTMEIEFYR